MFSLWKTTTSVNQSPKRQTTVGLDRVWYSSLMVYLSILIDVVAIVLYAEFMTEFYHLSVLYRMTKVCFSLFFSAYSLTKSVFKLYYTFFGRLTDQINQND